MPVFPLACNKRSLIQTPRFAHNQWFPHEGTGVMIPQPTAVASPINKKSMRQRWVPCGGLGCSPTFVCAAYADSPERFRLHGIAWWARQPRWRLPRYPVVRRICLAITASKFVILFAIARTKDCADHLLDLQRHSGHTVPCATLGRRFAASPSVPRSAQAML